MSHTYAARGALRLVVLVALGSIGLSFLAPAQASPKVLGPSVTVTTVPIPASGVLSVRGRGYGHGHGMSQWGAYGAATRGKSTQDILAFYYPGTSYVKATEPTLRIKLLIDSDGITEVAATTGLTVSTRTGERVVLPRSASGVAISRWRVIRDTTGLRLQYFTTTWRTMVLSARSSFSMVYFGPGADGQVRLVLGSTLRAYRGGIRALAREGGGSQTFAISTMANYLRSVVPSEMPASWPGAALRAQTVAARSYVLRERADKPSGTTWDTCDTTSCQVYSGVASYSLSGVLQRAYEHPLSDLAVSQTAGLSLSYGGRPALTQFSAANGGYGIAGTEPYLRNFSDPYDGLIPNSGNAWQDTFRASDLTKAYPQLGALRSIVVRRDGLGAWGGRIVTAQLLGTRGSVTISGSNLRTAAGLKSTWWLA